MLNNSFKLLHFPFCLLLIFHYISIGVYQHDSSQQLQFAAFLKCF